MKILILNGPNLNLQGRRQTDVYGSMTFDEYLDILRKRFADVEIDYMQSNVEGELINALHDSMGRYDGVVLNAGGPNALETCVRFLPLYRLDALVNLIL